MYSLEAKIRTENARTTRKSGRVIPAVLYGKDVPSTPITVGISEFIKIYRETGQGQIITLTVDKKKYNVLVQEAQRHPVTGDFLHLDFINVDMKKEIEVDTPITLVGESPAIVEGGQVHQILTELTVRCLPTDIVDTIEVDISGLNIGDTIHVSSIEAPKGITILNEPEDPVVNASEIKVVEEEPVETEETSEEGAEEGAETEGATEEAGEDEKAAE
ncbi:50S ribosomal protein L25/general stress protein Ctc [Candidatus Gracilibacteria bacterium]|nr:MAG: 50S ribosomal protein L25/general stress protein Ctc [Candidatus Gracilibacteria bacterium]